MNIYHDFCVPCLIRFGCAARPFDIQRKILVPEASGRVLEVGVGPGYNLRYYDSETVERVIGIEPNRGMRAMARKKLDQSTVRFSWLRASAEDIPLKATSFDSIVVTFTMCSVPNLAATLAELYRVLKDDGRMFFCEHGTAPDPNIRRWQDRLTPAWKTFTGGCHLNRDIPASIAQAGFEFDTLETEYLQGVPRLGGFIYRGAARKPVAV